LDKTVTGQLENPFVVRRSGPCGAPGGLCVVYGGVVVEARSAVALITRVIDSKVPAIVIGRGLSTRLRTGLGLPG
jgi:hypothetical protein